MEKERETRSIDRFRFFFFQFKSQMNLCREIEREGETPAHENRDSNFNGFFFPF